MTRRKKLARQLAGTDLSLAAGVFYGSSVNAMPLWLWLVAIPLFAFVVTLAIRHLERYAYAFPATPVPADEAIDLEKVAARYGSTQPRKWLSR